MVGEKESKEVYEEMNSVKGKLEVVKSERSPKTSITVSVVLPFDRKEEVAPAIIDLCKKLWDRYRTEIM